MKDDGFLEREITRQDFIRAGEHCLEAMRQEMRPPSEIELFGFDTTWNRWKDAVISLAFGFGMVFCVIVLGVALVAAFNA